MYFLQQLESNLCISFQIDWSKKLFLAHGVVCGMEYLHSIQPHPVIHGDLKIQNVLVGDGLVAKVHLRFIFCLDINVPTFVKYIFCRHHSSKLGTTSQSARPGSESESER